MLAYLGSNFDVGDVIVLVLLLALIVLPIWLVVEIIRWLRRH